MPPAGARRAGGTSESTAAVGVHRISADARQQLVRDVGRGPRMPQVEQGVGVWYLGTASGALRLSAAATIIICECLRAFGPSPPPPARRTERYSLYPSPAKLATKRAAPSRTTLTHPQGPASSRRSGILTYHWPQSQNRSVWKQLLSVCGCASRRQPPLYRSARCPVMACLNPAALARRRGRGRRRAAAWRQFSSSPAVWLLAAAQAPLGARLWMTPIRLPLRGTWCSKRQRAQQVE